MLVGLGRQEQGISTALSVEKTGQRQGKIINQHLEKQKTASGSRSSDYIDSKSENNYWIPCS